MVKIIPALLVEFGQEKPNTYDELTVYAVQFCIHLLANVCTELNVLRCHFQSQLVDIASISRYADVTVGNLKKKFLRESTHCGTKHLQKFVEQTKNGEIPFFDAGGGLHAHKLKFDNIKGSSRGGSFEDCMHLGKELVEKIVQNLNARMQEDMHVFNACKIFSPKHYPIEELEMETSSKAWMGTILSQFGTLADDIEKCMGEMDAFTMV
ncbi:hypothetical protein L7F22_023941 [Adiantum nelumboides]|nr:hypothetical protein [Adiantum nelumboides]